MAPRQTSLALAEPIPEPLPGPISLEVEDPTSGVSVQEGALVTENPDGSAEIDLNPDLSDPKKAQTEGFYRNLALEMDEGDLNKISADLIDGIDRDEISRKEWLETRARGIQLLGLKIEDPGDTSGSAPLEGMSRIRHPGLLEATIRFQATARSELLPSIGPVKVRNDSTLPPAKEPEIPPPATIFPEGGAPPGPAPFAPPPLPTGGGGVPPPIPGLPPPTPPLMGHNGGPPLDGYENAEEDAQALEKDMNHYLTVIASEYIPDTDRMLFYVGFGGDGFKKVFNCPLRRRPVSESVDAEDLIVSNAATDLHNCGRITHKIKMRKSILRRMQLIKAYLDVDLTQPVIEGAGDAVEQEKQDISGIRKGNERPEDVDHVIYETYCELEIDRFAPSQFKGKGLPLPYRVTIDRDSRKVLSVVRNWREDDEQCLAKRFFVQFPFVRGIGFYGLGFVHLLGNLTLTLTAIWREMCDAGMFANFPGFLYGQTLGKQLSNQLRVPPGGGVAIQLGAQQDIRQSVMPLPYKEPGPSFTAFATHLEEVGQRLGQTAQIQVGEGKQEAPVGTTLALIEQATKTLEAVHKRLHAAQAEEFGLLKERFREDPESFWRHNKKPVKPWKREQFLRALDNNDLVPVADPNNPTSLHRISKAMAVKQLQAGSPLLYDPVAVDKRVFRIVGIDPEGLFRPVPAQPPPDPRVEAIKEKAKANQTQQMVMDADSKRKMELGMAQLIDRQQDRASKERIEALKLRLEELRFMDEHNAAAQEVQARWIELQADLEAEIVKNQSQLQIEQQRGRQELQIEAARNQAEIAMDHRGREQEMHMQRREQEDELVRLQREHDLKMSLMAQEHAAKLQMQKELNDAKVEQAKALAKVQKANKPKPSGSKAK